MKDEIRAEGEPVAKGSGDSSFILPPSSFPPIPPLAEPPNWARLPITDCGEPLIALGGGEDAQAGVLARPLYADMAIPGAGATVYVRAGVRNRLRQAAALLPPPLALFVFDGYRPLVVQRYLYDNFTEQVRRENPLATDDEVTLLVRRFVAAPNADPACPPPHRTGGAVDLYLVERETGRALPMGTEPDEIAPASRTRWFEERPKEPFTTNRRILYHAMTSVGFANYLGEWWHFDFGNQRWANCIDAPEALYAAAPEPAEQTG